MRKCPRAQHCGAGAQPACLLISVPVPGPTSLLTVPPSRLSSSGLTETCCVSCWCNPPPPCKSHLTLTGQCPSHTFLKPIKNALSLFPKALQHSGGPDCTHLPQQHYPSRLSSQPKAGLTLLALLLPRSHEDQEARVSHPAPWFGCTRARISSDLIRTNNNQSRQGRDLQQGPRGLRRRPILGEAPQRTGHFTPGSTDPQRIHK